ncbi:MAG: response regulator [Alphaproteobacteria bacterium]|nr:response regulator [Alphaproteobacteria bacterium]NNF23650.1 response regulator [Paracoccaceae bacterium]
MFDEDRLAQERRARLAAEHFYQQKKSELVSANDQIAAHAKTLTDEIIVTREQAKAARSEAEAIKGEFTQVRTDLHQAQAAAIVAERRLWDSLETIQDGFAVFDRSRTLIVSNNAYLSVFEDLECARPGATYAELVRVAVEEGIVDTGDLRPREWVEMMNARWEAEMIDPITLRLWNNQYVRIMDRRTRDGDTVSLALNITSSMRREATLTKAREKAEAASQAKSSFLANMSHEIRTPMNGVVAMADLLAESALDEEQGLYVDTIRNSGEALLVIINDILDYSKIEAGKLVLKHNPFDLERTIHDVLTLVQATAKEKGLELIVDYDMFLPTKFSSDPGRFRQILTNLIGNAVKFTQEGHVLVRVIGVPVQGGTGQKIHITVEDTGIGLDEDKKDHVFGEFNQAESDTKRSYDGTGLGLAITRRLVEIMGGEIWVDSEPGVGSSFGLSVTLPIVEPADMGGARTPDWIERGFVFDARPASCLVLEKQIASLGLKPVRLANLADLAEQELAPTDVVLVANADHRGDRDMLPADILGDTRARGAVILIPAMQLLDTSVAGPAEYIPTPLLRRDLLERLARLPAPERLELEDELAGTAEVVAEAEHPQKCPSDAGTHGAATGARVEAGTALATQPPDTAELADTANTAAAPVEPADTAVVEAVPLPDTQEAQPAPLASDVPTPDDQQVTSDVVASGDPAEPGPAPADPAATPVASQEPAPSLETGTTAGGVPAGTAEIGAAAAPQAGTADRLPPAAEARAPALRAMRVLAAEDNKTNRLVLSKMLKSLDIDLIFAENGQEAVDAFKAQRPDLFLTDISMPVLDGKDATRAIRQIEDDENMVRLPIVAMTAHAMEGDREEILQAGIDYYLTKPLKKAALIEHILAALPEGVRPPVPDEAPVATPEAALAAS